MRRPGWLTAALCAATASVTVARAIAVEDVAPTTS
jgi:hypothetical protein